jgi:solute carrier family 25 carnitine/acylcarnitine transporter 20/29
MAFSRDLVAGSVAGMTTTLCMAPLDTLRTRLQAGAYPNARQALRELLAHEGARALYKGMSLPLAAQGVYKAILFSAYGASARRAEAWQGLPAALRACLCGSFAGCLNAVVVCPVELVRNRLQMQRKGGAALGPLGVAAQAVREAGVPGLWRGLSATVCRDGLGVGAWFGAFGWAKARLLGRGVSADLAVPLAGCCAGVSFWSVALVGGPAPGWRLTGRSRGMRSRRSSKRARSA